MWTSIFATTTALVIAGSSAAYAQNRPGHGDMPRWRPNVEDMSALADARLAGLKAGLQLKTDQEKHWPAFEAAARDFQKQRIQALTNRSINTQRLNPLEQMQRQAETLTQRGSTLKTLADATAPLYGSLDDGQKRRFAMLNPLGSVGDYGRRFRSFDGGRREWNRGQGGFRRTGVDGLDRAGPGVVLLTRDPGEQIQ